MTITIQPCREGCRQQLQLDGFKETINGQLRENSSKKNRLTLAQVVTAIASIALAALSIALTSVPNSAAALFLALGLLIVGGISIIKKDHTHQILTDAFDKAVINFNPQTSLTQMQFSSRQDSATYIKELDRGPRNDEFLVLEPEERQPWSNKIKLKYENGLVSDLSIDRTCFYKNQQNRLQSWLPPIGCDGNITIVNSTISPKFTTEKLKPLV